ncbi:MAG: cation transporter [Caulobacter sp.]|nr:cation transporter [Caulobacter sp.]
MTSLAPTTRTAISSCGCGDSQPFDGATPEYRRILLWVIAINLVAFVVVSSGGLLAGSASVAANALDFLADSATYAISLWAISKSAEIRSGTAIVKGASLGVLGVAVLGFAGWRAVNGIAPEGLTISGLGLFGVAANFVAAILLSRHRDGDANVRSVWLCTRNDLIQCLAVVVTGGLVWFTRSAWPDIIVGAILAIVFLQSAWSIIAQAQAERRDSVLAAD